MGIYLNPDNDGFRESIRSKIYVDKTGLIAYTNEIIHTEQKFTDQVKKSGVYRISGTGST